MGELLDQRGGDLDLVDALLAPELPTARVRDPERIVALAVDGPNPGALDVDVEDGQRVGEREQKAERVGGARDLKELGGLAHLSPALAALFFVAGMSLAGLPPTSGFFSKFLVVTAGLEAERYFGVTICFVAGILTLFSMMKIWTMGFWGAPVSTTTTPPRRGVLLATALLVSFSVTIAIGAEPLYRFTTAAAEQVLDTTRYVDAVFAPGGRP